MNAEATRDLLRDSRGMALEVVFAGGGRSVYCQVLNVYENYAEVSSYIPEDDKPLPNLLDEDFYTYVAYEHIAYIRVVDTRWKDK